MNASFQIGARIGRFRLVSPLDEGAMGRVWLAEGPSEPVAIKELNLKEPDMAERFEREALALMKLRHPNVVRAFDYGHADDGTPFLAMELLEGESLEDRLHHSGRIDIEEAINIVYGAALGLGAAHSIGLVHRDVKPGNLFLTTDDQVKVIDFGIAFWSGADGRARPSRLTLPGTVLGTPSYMAPEQAKGDRDENVTTDVWGLGAVLYHAVSGREPFQAGGNYLAELTRILTEPPDPLPDRVPPNVAATIMRALSKTPSQRFASMAEFAQALRAQAPAPPPRISSIDVMGTLSDEVRLVTAVLVEGLAVERHGAFVDAVKRYGGIGSPMLGRRAVATFGGDEWLGDEAERAVRLALDAKTDATRIGIGTGKAVRRIDARGAVTGQAIAAAQQALSADEPTVETLRPQAIGTPPRAVVVVCPETARRVQGGFALVGSRVVGLLPGGRALRPREVGGREVPFVGRDEALEELIDAVSEVDELRKSAAVVICGPPGIGKSRLRFELMRWVAEEELPARQLEARGELARGRSSFDLIRELLRSQAAMSEGTDPGEARERIETLVASAGLDAEATRDTTDFVGELLGVPFPDNAHLSAARADPRLMNDRIRMAVRALFAGWSERGLVIVAIEDAQWADAASLAFLETLLEELHDRPLALVVSARPTFMTEHDALNSAQLIELGDLDDAAIARIVACVLGRDEPAVVERAAGNPYLAEELSLAVKEGADPSALPLTVEGTVLARLDKLAPDEKDLLKRAAVLGRRFWKEGLEALGEPLAAKLLGALRRRDLVVRGSDSRLGGCEEWFFRQAIVYEVCLGLLTDDQRQRLHRAAGSWLSQVAEATPEEIAEHFARAEEPQRATLWWLRALNAAHERGSSYDVVAASDRILTTGALPSGEAFTVRMLRCEAFHWLGDRAGVEQELRVLSTLTDETDTLSFAALAEVRRWQAEHVQLSGHLEPALFAARQAVRLADSSRSRDLQVRARATLVSLHTARGEFDEAAKLAQEALDVAKQGSGVMIRATAARALAQLEMERGNLSSALFYFRMARNLCMEVRALREATGSSVGVGACLVLLGYYAEAGRTLEAAVSTAEGLELRSIVGWAKHHWGLAIHRLGDAPRALRLEDEASLIARERDEVPLAIATLQHRSLIERETGAAARALTTADEALALCLRHDARRAESLCHTLRAQSLVDLGRHEEALAACAAGSDDDLALLLARHDALLQLDRPDEAAATLRTATQLLDAIRASIDSATLRATYSATPVPSRLTQLVTRKSPTHP